MRGTGRTGRHGSGRTRRAPARSADIIETVQTIRAALPAIKATIPLGTDVAVVLDRTTTIRRSPAGRFPPGRGRPA